MEQKLVLAIKEDSALFLFKKPNKVEFVVAYLNGPACVGDNVSSWFSGHYFQTLEDAIKYFEKL